MPAEPIIELLSYQRRKRFFWSLVLIFMITLPVAIFYTTGYRISYVGDTATIMPTGGLYVNTDTTEIELWVNEEPVRNARLFRSAYYIQNIEAGMHRVVAQQTGLQTWVKNMPVDPYLVAEVTAFNLPVVPQIRLITEYETATGTAVVGSDQLTLLQGVSTTPPYIMSTSSATSSLVRNQEYDVLTTLFASSTQGTSSPRVSLLAVPELPPRFRFATTSADGGTSTPSLPNVVRNDMRLSVRDGEIYAEWIGNLNRIPNYFCIASGTASTTIARYGQHVFDQVTALWATTTPPWNPDATKLCRPEIPINRLRQTVYAMDFVPGRSDLVVLLLEDGVYVSEIDDWSWQNTQRLYAGVEPRLVIDNGRMYAYDQGVYFELLLTLITS